MATTKKAPKAAKSSEARRAKRANSRRPQYVVYAAAAPSSRISDQAIEAAVRVVVNR
jgi:hypothetical protein